MTILISDICPTMVEVYIVLAELFVQSVIVHSPKILHVLYCVAWDITQNYLCDIARRLDIA